jgi:putative nucleotidyltransferase with HDIG domain
MESRDPYTAGHQKSVAKISVALAASLGWAEAEQQVVYLAGLVHDIGKIAVPSEILTKPSKLSEIEMSLVREHVEAGYQILKDIPFPWPIASIIRQHHERLDGSGYPQRLSGDEILPGARILAVADMIEAMSTHRPYRPALGLAFAIGEIKKESGVTLDAEVVNAACQLMQDGKLDVLIRS